MTRVERAAGLERVIYALLVTIMACCAALASGEARSEDDAAAIAEHPQSEDIASLRAALRETAREHGPGAPQLIPVLEKLAALELAAGEREFAAIRLERVVELRRFNDGFYSQSLTTPLLQLANIYLEAGLYERAITKLRYAQHLTHRRDGVYSLEQVALIENLARAFLGQDEPDEAHREMKLAFNLSRRVHGEDNVEHVPGMLRYAAWYRFIGADRKARHLYKNAISMLEAEHGESHHSLIEPLTHLSATASRPWYYKSDREMALLRADEILNQQAGVDAEDRAASAIRLGDFYTHLKDPHNAHIHYQRAWSILKEQREERLDAEKIFAQPIVLNFPHSILPDTRRGILIQEREITVTYDIDIDESGKVSRVAVVNHSGPVAITRTLRKTAFSLRFRPRIENGQPVATQNYRVTETIRIDSPVSRSLFLEQLREEIERLRRLLQVGARVR